MYVIRYSAQMVRDVRRMARRGKDMEKMNTLIDALARGETLPPQCRDHALSGDMEGFRDFHVAPDWIVIYKVVDEELLLYCMRTGTHSDIFGR